MRRLLASLQVRLIGAFVGLVIVALLVSAGVFVAVRRGEQEQRAIEQVVAESPSIYGEFSLRNIRGETPSALVTFVGTAAQQHGVRIILLDRSSTVAADSGANLVGKRIAVPPEAAPARLPGVRIPSYYSWKPAAGSPGSGLIMVISDIPSLRFNAGGGGRQPAPTRPADGYSLLLVVPDETISRAWLGLLPALGAAAAIALPVAVLLALLLARSITRPLKELTLASDQMARGTFDVQVATRRHDEVGQLARAFSTMVENVGGTQRQMRTLVADVSHDLKTPLTSIIGFAGALSSGKARSEAEVRRMGSVIEEEASRLSGRLNDLLLLSELESGRAMLDTAHVDLGRLVTSVAERVFGPRRPDGFVLQLDAPPGTVIPADGPKLERAVENLLDNARKYTPAGGEIMVRTAGEAGGTARLEVSNTCADLTPDELPRLFERFYRRDRARSGRSAGSGLGLPIARDLVRLHGGTLDASLRGGLLVFTASLPAGA